MPQVLITNLSQYTYDRLKDLAEQNGRSLTDEARGILEDAVQKRTADEFRKRAAEWRRRNGPQTSDSVDLIREDRER